MTAIAVIAGTPDLRVQILTLAQVSVYDSLGLAEQQALLAALDELADADEKTPQLSGPDSMQH